LHPLTRAKLTLNRAVALQEQVGDAEAMRAWDEAVAAYRSATWAGHPALSRALLKRGEFSLWKQDSEAAARDFTAALPGLESDAASHTRSLRSAHTGARAGGGGAPARRSRRRARSRPRSRFGGEDDPLLASVGCEARLVAGAPREARLFATREVELLREADDAMAAARAEVHLGEVLMYLGDAPAARAQLEAALQHFAELGGAATQDTAYARKALGLLALRGRDEATAEAALTGALALWDAEPCGCRDAAEAQLGLAVLLGRRGDAGAPALRSAADAYFKPLGAEAIAHRDRVVAFVDADPLLEDPEDMP
jgi:tetratricopeptide (TPR) repeat protein